MGVIGFGRDREAGRLSVGRKLLYLDWILVLMLCVAGAAGIAMLYSAANGNWSPWAARQSMRLGVALLIMIGVALIDIRFWIRHAYLMYGLALALVVAVEFVGAEGMGAQRWIKLGFIQLQPSELMKIGLVLGLARYFHGRTGEEVRQFRHLVVPLGIVLLPAMLVLRQPDLGTASMLILGGGAMLFLAGVRLRWFAAALAVVLASMPIAWSFMRPYQRRRIFTFLDPGSDPLGAGYHILQSKIALGSGGLTGKGFLAGTQSRLNFLPEKQTDFVFTMLAEEMGLVGGVALILLFLAMFGYLLLIAVNVRNQFGRLLVMGIAATLFLYVFINIAMVMGLIPVVGVPLPLISYGGTAMLTVLTGFGLAMSASIHRHVQISRHGHADG